MSLAGNYGYSTAAAVFQVGSENSPKMYVVAATPGEAVDIYLSNLAVLPALDQELLAIRVTIVNPIEVYTSDSNAGASSGVAATAQAWATTYAAAVAVGASAVGSTQGTQIILKKAS
jgi:hypothetical protein